MQTRRFGRTNHQSTIIIFGGAALGNVPQAEADRAIEMALAHGVNHIDIAPSYGEAVTVARDNGFAVNQLIRTRHDRPGPRHRPAPTE